MEPRQAVTIRFPAELLDRARTVRGGAESFNDLVVESLEKEVRRRQGLVVLGEIRCLREQIKAESGIHPDSVPLIRALREGEGRRG